MEKKYIAWIFVAFSLSLSGCSGGAGTALAALAGSAVTTGGSFALSAAKEDIAEAAEWRATQKDIVSQIRGAMLTKARGLEDTDWDASMSLYQETLDFNWRQQPKILLERLGDRIRRAKERRAKELESE